MGSFVRFSDPEQPYVFQSSYYYYNRMRSGLVGPNGTILFPNGVAWVEIDPDQILPEKSDFSFNVDFVDIYVLGDQVKPGPHSLLEKPLWMTDEISLSHRAETFSVTFSDFDFKSDHRTFEYRLFPYEQLWKRTANNAVVNYYKVPSGRYELQVKSRKQSGLVNSEISTLQVHKLPPWWRAWWAYVGYLLIVFLGGWTVHRYQKERTIRMEREKTRERELAQAREIEKAYSELKATQSQLIHSEKMASLGELTAGIAHEIQNPLNFVNNFSEVSAELAHEAKQELKKGDASETDEILDDLVQNLEKINHHGKRASGIVKAMLDHSRANSEDRVYTDINALAEEYLRLAYHGLRAKDSTFQAKFSSSFDPNLPRIEVASQDIGRVLLNLISNAFYEVHIKKVQNGGDFQPEVKLSTALQNGSIQITIEDNGNGISEEMKDKIFQPFYTTKPAGQGTGLGLSLAYDIVKAHGGELKVESEEGEGSSFTIVLPLSGNMD